MSLITRGIWRLAELEYGVHSAVYKISVITGSDTLSRAFSYDNKTRQFTRASLKAARAIIDEAIDAYKKAGEAIDALLAHQPSLPGDEKPQIAVRRTP